LGALFAGLITLIIFFILHSVVLPFAADIGMEIGVDYGLKVIEFFDRSKFMLPLVYALPHLAGF
jgi:hypothetical protein